MARVLLIVVVVVVVLLGLLWVFQRRLIYLPYGSPPPAAAMLPGAREAVLTASDGLRLGAWHLPAAAGRPTVLVAGGNAGNRSFRAPLARALAAKGLGVLLFDYRGYGGNPGNPSEKGLALDVRAARHYLVAQGVDRIIYFGESLGCAVVTELATAEPPAALVLRSPFVDLASVGQVHYPFLPVRALLWDRFPLASQLAQVKAPVLVVYGSRDSIIPPGQSREVASVLSGTRVVEVAGADHNDQGLLDGPELISAIAGISDALPS